MSIQRIVLNINGVDREILCEPEKDSLADVVRRLGLTGTKVGCGTGHCGACSLLLDGEVTRSCVKKMKQVKAYAKVETIEGIGSAERLHPLQRAFMTYASVQCGFCSPGFIMSAKGLLMRNPDPTREEVREWFTRHGNVCRCTGYKPIVDAVMEAAAVMRGEKAMEAILKPNANGSSFGVTKVHAPEELPAAIEAAFAQGDEILIEGTPNFSSPGFNPYNPVATPPGQTTVATTP